MHCNRRSKRRPASNDSSLQNAFRPDRQSITGARRMMSGGARRMLSGGAAAVWAKAGAAIKRAAGNNKRVSMVNLAMHLIRSEHGAAD